MQARVKDITKIIESYFPLQLAEKWDNTGLQIGSFKYPVSRVLVALDIDMEVLHFAQEQKADMIITHHPLFFNPIKLINYDKSIGNLLKAIIEAGITIYAAHTNLDTGERGLNQILAERIGLHDIKPLDKGHSEELYKLVVYVPIDHEQTVRQAILEAGAGHIGKYRDCSYRVRGTSTFLPLAGSTPYIGQEGMLQEVEEYRLETILPKSQLETVLPKMLQAHPYEEAAYDLYRLERPGQVFSLGRIGRLDAPISLGELGNDVKRKLDLKYLRIAGDMTKLVSKVAVVSGAGASFIGKARSQGCDVLITGDLKYHEAREAADMGIAVIDAGHQGTEQLMSTYLSNLLNEETRKRNFDVEAISVLNRECIVTI